MKTSMVQRSTEKGLRKKGPLGEMVHEKKVHHVWLKSQDRGEKTTTTRLQQLWGDVKGWGIETTIKLMNAFLPCEHQYCCTTDIPVRMLLFCLKPMSDLLKTQYTQY